MPPQVRPTDSPTIVDGAGTGAGIPTLDEPVTVWLRGIQRHVAAVIAEGEARRALGHLTYLGWQDVSATPIASAALPEIAARIRTESVIDYVSFASAELLAAPPPNATHQIQHARMLLQASTLERTISLLQTGAREAFIHQEQLLSAAKLAIHYGQRGRGRAEDLETVGTLLLAVNDCLMDLPADAPMDEDRQADIRALVARRSGFLTHESAVLLIARYGDLLLRRSRTGLESGRIALDFDERFEQATGWTLLEHMAAASFYTIPFLRPQAAALDQSDATAAQPKLESVPWRDIGDVLKEIDADGYTDQLRDRLSLDRVAFANALCGPGVDISHGERIELFRHPLFRREDGSIVPLNLAIAADNMSIGAYWALHGACASLDPHHGVNALTADMGRLFEDYTDDLLDRAYSGAKQRGVLHREARRDRRGGAPLDNLIDPYRNQAGQLVDPTDAVVVEEDGIVLIEVTARTLPIEAVVSGVAGAFDHYVVRIAEKFAQIGRFANDLESGRVIIPGVAIGRRADVYPVVALLHPFRQHYATWEVLEAAIEAPAHPALDSLWLTMQAPQLITAEELEMLEPHLRDGLTLAGLLREKVASPRFRHRSMKDFLLHRKQIPDRPNEHVDRLYDEAFDRVRPLITDHLRIPWDAGSAVRAVLDEQMNSDQPSNTAPARREDESR